MKEQIYEAMKSGDIGTIKNICSSGYRFWESDWGADYDSPLHSAIKGYHVAEDSQQQIVEVMCHCLTMEVIERFRCHLVHYGHLTAVKRHFGLTVCPTAMIEAESLQKNNSFTLTMVRYFEVQNSKLLGAEVIGYALNGEKSQEAWHYLSKIYHENEMSPLSEKRSNGASPYSDSFKGSQVCYYGVGAWQTRFSIKLYPGEYNRHPGAKHIVVYPSPFEKEWQHPFDAQWDLLPTPAP